MSNNIIKEENKEYCLENITFSRNIQNSFCRWGLDNAFTSFNFNNISFLIYATINKSIISFDLNNEIIITEIKNAHEKDITNFRYYIKEINNKCIIMSISGENQNIKLWNFLNWECIFNLSSFYKFGSINFSCFLNEDDKDYIIISDNSDKTEIKIYDFSGCFIKSITDSQDKTLFIDCIQDKIKTKNYIITGNHKYIKSFDYNENKLYNIYNDNAISWHCFVKYIYSKNKSKLLDSCWGDDNIRIWDFHLGILIKKIKTNGQNIKCLCVYNNNFIFVGAYDHTMKLVDIENEKVLKTFKGHIDWVCTINKISHKKYGECLISAGLGKKETIKIWVINNYNNKDNK